MKNNFLELIDKGASESRVQEFLERNPAIVCGSAYLMGDAVISKFRLGVDLVTDFAYVNPRSGSTLLFLVEIEDPGKPIFNKDDQFTEHFNQAYQQLEDWLGWCVSHREELRQLFLPLTSISGENPASYVPRGLLIYGRRAELTSARRRERWQSKSASNPFVVVRTYDGFCEDRRNFIPPDGSLSGRTVCVSYRNRRFLPKRQGGGDLFESK